MEEIKDLISQLLPSTSNKFLPEIMQRLEEKGVESVEDLKYIRWDQDFSGILKEVPARKLKEKMDIFLSGSTLPTASPSNNDPFPFPTASPSNNDLFPLPTASPLQETCTQNLSAVESPNDWADLFEIPVQRFSKHVFKKMEKKIRPTPGEIRELIRILVDEILLVYKKPRKQHLIVVAKKFTTMFPCMLDMIEGSVIGSGYDGVLRKLITRVENVRRPSCTSIKKNLTRKVTLSDTCGSSNFLPELPEKETMEAQQEKKLTMQCDFVSQNWDLEVTDELMMASFPAQRLEIVDKKMSIPELKGEWPFLFLKRYMLKHFEALMSCNLEDLFEEAMKKKIPELLLFMKNEGLCNDSTPLLKCVEILALYFKENTKEVLKIFQEHESLNEVISNNEMKTLTPFIAAFGNPYGTDKNCIVLVEKVVASEFVDIKEALLIWFATFYVFGLQYPDGCPATAEFIQRVLFGINPEKGTKSKKRSRRSNLNSKVSQLVDKLCNFKTMWTL